MPLIAKNKGGGNFELVPEDQHVARCVLIADLGTQQSTYQGEVIYKREVVIGWELPECQQVFDEEKGKEPAMLSQFYTLSLSEKANLRSMLQGWRGRAFTEEELDGFDVLHVASVPCLLQVIHAEKRDGSKRAKIQQVSKLPKGMTCPDQINPTRLFTLDESGEEDLRALPEWLRERVKKGKEYGAWVRRVNGRPDQPEIDEPTFASDEVHDDEVPF